MTFQEAAYLANVLIRQEENEDPHVSLQERLSAAALLCLANSHRERATFLLAYELHRRRPAMMPLGAVRLLRETARREQERELASRVEKELS
jgi:hypothetical protein